MISYDVLKFAIFSSFFLSVLPWIKGQLAKTRLFIVLFLDNSDKVFFEKFPLVFPLCGMHHVRP